MTASPRRWLVPFAVAAATVALVLAAGPGAADDVGIEIDRGVGDEPTDADADADAEAAE